MLTNRQVKKAKKRTRELKRVAPYLFVEWQEYQSLKKEYRDIKKRYKEAKKAWESSL